MRTRLVALDLDGTLLTSARTPHPGAAQALRRANDAGIAICLASGRVAASIGTFVELIGAPCWVVACNGAHVLSPEGHEVHHFTTPRDVVQEIFGYAKSEGIHLNVYSRSRVIAAVEGPLGGLYRARARQVQLEPYFGDSAPEVPATKLMLVDEADRITRRHAQFLDRYEPDQVALTISEPEYLEFLPPGIDKSTGLSAVASRLNIGRDAVAAIGDYDNDAEMIAWAGFGAAMSNASASARAAAQRTFASNDEGGVAEFIDCILENLRQ